MLSDLSIYLIQFVFFLGQLFFPGEVTLIEDIVSEIEIERNVLGALNEADTESFEETIFFFARVGS